jgi:4-hydroxy-2-oxoheptanedioate aldolase
MANTLREAWAEGRPAFGLWSMMPGSFGVELLASARPDYVCIDQQHGLADLAALIPMLAAAEAAGATPLVRVLRNDPADIGKVLDAGARGVIVPLVNNASEAARAVQACRYPPEGNRSYGPVRASLVFGTGDPVALGREVSCIVMVETREGLENVEEIAATPGVDGIYVGPSDLALSLGLPPTLDPVEPTHVEAVARIKDACKHHGIGAGIHTASAEVAKRHAEAGFDMVTTGTDATLLADAALERLVAVRGESDPVRG